MQNFFRRSFHLCHFYCLKNSYANSFKEFYCYFLSSFIHIRWDEVIIVCSSVSTSDVLNYYFSKKKLFFFLVFRPFLFRCV